MAHYRVYKLRGAGEVGRRIVKGKDLDAPDDGQAMREAEKDPDCPVCEVWRGAEKVGDVL